jgi:hypothetical protein
MTLTYHASVEDGKIQMHESNRRKMAKEVGYGFDGHDIELTVKKKKRTRSNPQNAYYWSVVIPMLIDGFIDAGNGGLQSGNAEHQQWMHEEMKRLHLDNGIEISDAHGEITKLPASTKTCSTIEFMEYMQDIQKWAAECLSIDIPDPNEQRELAFILG